MIQVGQQHYRLSGARQAHGMVREMMRRGLRVGCGGPFGLEQALGSELVHGEMLLVLVPKSSQLADILHYQHWQACVEGILSKKVNST
jgi:hypothetical protein